jgi:hypothetical protein
MPFVRPHLLQPRDGRGRQSAGVRAEQGGERLGEVAGGNTLQVEPSSDRTVLPIKSLLRPDVRLICGQGGNALLVSGEWRSRRCRAYLAMFSCCSGHVNQRVALYSGVVILLWLKLFLV